MKTSKCLTPLCLLLVLAAEFASASLLDIHWLKFKNQFGKSYSNATEELMRKQIFAANKEFIDNFNQNKAQTAGWRMEVNHLSDLTREELKRLTGLQVPKSGMLKNTERAQKFLDNILYDSSPLPESVDWRKVPGKVTEVKDQGMCGSCWAIATAGMLEAHKNRTQKWTDLSAQDLVDCSKRNHGCKGGFPYYALKDIKELGGIEDEIDYPYKGEEGTCRFERKKAAITDDDAVVLPPNDEEALKIVVAKYGPVSVGISTSMYIVYYKSGVLTNDDCTELTIDHGVLVVGYGTDKSKGDYWIVKNSWNKSWGEEGYMRMARGHNLCNIASWGIIAAFYNN